MRANEGDSLWQLFDSALFDSSTSATEIGLPSIHRLPCAASARLEACPRHSELPIEATPPIEHLDSFELSKPTLPHQAHDTST
jgi:hypothetical protein